jgi:hypothetical protein
MRGWMLGSSLACVIACTTSGYAPQSDAAVPLAAVSGGAGSRSDPDDDRDHDGLCNGTEAALASDPDRPDTDRDGLPDFTEAFINFSATDPLVPAPDQVAYLAATSTQPIDFEVRMTVFGSGLGYTGEFRGLDAPDARGITAKDFYLGAEAVGGEPVDNVRGIQAESERFESVLGKTRVSFQLHFAIGATKVLGCALGYPFEYRLKDDSGRYSAARDYLLIVAPDLNANGEHTFCVPASCM